MWESLIGLRFILLGLFHGYLRFMCLQGNSLKSSILLNEGLRKGIVIEKAGIIFY